MTSYEPLPVIDGGFSTMLADPQIRVVRQLVCADRVNSAQTSLFAGGDV